MTDVPKTTTDGADEVIGDNWPSDSASDVADAAEEQRGVAAKMDEAGRAAAQGKAYASQEMEGAAAEALEAKYGFHMGQFADRMQAHLYTAGWLSMLAMAITSAKNAMNAAVAMHSPDHAGPVTEFHTQTQKDQSLHTAQQAVQAAKENLEHVKATVVAGISGGQKPPMVPALPTGGKTPTTKPADRPPGQPATGLPATDPTAPNPYSPANTNPGLNNPGGPSAPAPAAPVSPLGGSAGRAPAATLPPPTLNDLPAGGGSGLGGSPMGSGSPFGGSPMGGMPMGGMPPMQPPQMPQLPTQTPGNDIAKTVGDTVGKLAGAHNGQPISSDTLGKLLDAQRGDGAGAGAGGAGGLGDDKGTVVKNDDGTLVDDGKNGHGLKPHTPGPGLGGPAGGPSDPYSAENRNPSLNNPAGPQVTGPPSPAAPTVTPQPPVVSAPITQLSADDATPPPAAHTAAATGGDPTQAGMHTAANGNGSSTAPSPGGANGAQPASAQGQQQPSSGVGGALGAYPGGAGFAPLPPAPPMSPAMMSGSAMPAALGAAAVGGAAATPVIMPAKTATTSTSSNTGGALAADPAAAASVERITVLPPEHAVAHEHLAGVVKALRDRPG
ncbi:hypothetical protein, partial [Mycobacterium bouchedurhonense]|uniref:hypothetical protein n=2 Tax=Mycobacterium avium complex (MAC) TaxID=120793 RepID=UPI0036099EB5